MFKILDDDLSQYTQDYLGNHNIKVDDVEVIKVYIKETKRLVNNLKIYFVETKRANKYKLIPNFLLNRRMEDKINNYDDNLSFMNKEISNELKDLRKMKAYINSWRIPSKLKSCSNTVANEQNQLIPIDILNRDSLIIKDYLNNTSEFIDSNIFNLESIATQTYINSTLDIAQNNITNQENNYFNNLSNIKNNEDFVRDVYFASYSILLKSVNSESKDPIIVQDSLESKVKKIKKQYNLNKNTTLIDDYVKTTYNDIENVYKSRMISF